mgnify:CR=1 FL=1
MIADLPTLEEVLEKLSQEGIITWPQHFRLKDTNETLTSLDVDLSSRVCTNHPTRSAGEMMEHEQHEKDRQI